MTRSDDDLLRDALRADAGSAVPGPNGFDAVRAEAHGRGRGRRRTILAAVAAVAVVALGAGAVFAVSRDDDNNRITAGPSPSADAPDEVLAVVNGALVVLRIVDGSIVRELVPTDGRAPVVSTTTVRGAPQAFYTQLADDSTECGATTLNSVMAPSDEVTVGGSVGRGLSSPTMSPDGRWLAYRVDRCGDVIGEVGLTRADTTEESRLTPGTSGAPADEIPIAWTPDSKRLLVRHGNDDYRLANVPSGGSSEPVDLPAGVYAGAFLSDDELLIAYRTEEGDVLAQHDVRSGRTTVVPSVTDTRPSIRSISYDAASDATLIVAMDELGTNGNGQLFVRDASGKISGGVSVLGMTGAVWYAPGDTSSLNTTTVPEETTTSVPETTTSVSTTPTTAPFTGSTLPPPTDVAGYTEYRTVGLETLEEAYRAEAGSPQAKVDELVAFLRDEPIEGRKGAEGVVNSIQGNRATVEVRVLGVASDSHAGFDYRLYLLQEMPDGPWKVVAAELRDLCSRAFDGSLCV